MQRPQFQTDDCSALMADTTHGAFLLHEVIEDCNERACAIWGSGRDVVIGKTLLDLSPAVQSNGGESGAEIGRRIAAARKGLSQAFEWQFCRSDGEPVDGLVTLDAVRVDGRTCLIGRVRDVTYLNDAESALRETETRLQQILNNTTAIVYVKDRDGRFLFVNQQFQSLFREPEGDLVGKLDREVFPEAIAEAYRRNDLQVLEASAPMEFEETGLLEDGEHTYISIKFPLFNTNGTAYAVCGISTDITERKRSEEALRNVALGLTGATGPNVFTALVRYLATALHVDFAFIGKLIDDSTGRLRTLAMYHRGDTLENIEYNLAGTPCEGVVGKQFRYIPEDVQKLFPGENMLKVLGFESYAGYPLFDSHGNALGLIAVTHSRPLVDRTVIESTLKIFSARAAAELERQKADDALRASEEQYRSIFNAAVDGLILWTPDGRIVDVNPAFGPMHGYTREELLRIVPSQFIPPESQADYRAFMEAVSAGKSFHTEAKALRKDGSRFDAEIYGTPVDYQGKPHLLATVRDISERKEREHALQRSEDRLRATVEAALDCIISMDDKGNIIGFNPAAESCFGYTREKVLGKPLVELLIPERYRDAHMRGMHRYLKTGEGPFLGRRVEVSATRADGTEFPAELAIDVARGTEGHIFIGYLRDITERKRAEDERARLESQLRQAQKMEAIGHLTGGVAHDFNNILTGMMGYVVLAQERAERYEDAKLRRYLDRAEHSGQRARDLIQQMLTFSRGQRGEPRPLALTPLVKESVKLLGSTLPSSVEIRTEFDAALPSALLDPVHVEQVLMNLCINARDAMRGHGRLTLTVHRVNLSDRVCASCRQPVEGVFVELAVSDTGPGIPPEVLDRMFEPFYSTKEVGKGSGMGLATVHGIVHEYGGHVLVDTSMGGGTAVRVLFAPLQSTAGADEDAAQQTVGHHGGRPALLGRVLVVDDEPSVGEFMQDLLDSWGLDVTVFNHSVDACKHFAGNPDQFDLVVLDQTMPKMTGVEVAEHLLKLRPDLPVVLYTGHSDEVSEELVQRKGIRALVRKPVDVSQFRALVERLVQGMPV